MANPWFRLYVEFDSDPKVQCLSEAMQRRLIMLFCWRGRDETLQMFHETRAAFHWRITPAELAETKQAFLDAGFINEAWELQNWNKRQFISDNSTERVRRHRQQLKQDETVVKQPTTVTTPLRNVSVTPPDTDTDTETYTEKQKQKPPRGKREGDPRHTSIKEMLTRYWEFANPGEEMPWGREEAGQLGSLLRASPTLTPEQFRICLQHRHQSDGVNTAARPMEWLAKITSYSAGPLNQFQQPKNGETHGTGRTQQIAKDLQIALAARRVDSEKTGEGPADVHDGEVRPRGFGPIHLGVGRNRG